MNLTNDLKTKKPIFGFDVNLKKLKNSKIKTLYVSSNCPNKERLEFLSKSSSIELVQLKEDSKELGILCKKSFSVSVIGFE